MTHKQPIAALVIALLLGFSTQASAADKPVKVFILAGQSNMQGHAHVRTFDAMALNPTTAAILKEMRSDDGKPRVCEQVWIASFGSSDEEKIGQLTAGFGAGANGPKIGPEFTFGIYMQKILGEPIVIIKTSWGGRSLHTDFRPPSAGPYEFNEAQLANFKKQNKDLEAMKAEKAKATGESYRQMIAYVNKVLADPKRVYPGYDAKAGYELAGFVWLQGWNDMVDGGTYPDRDKDGGYDQYSKVLGQFIRDVRKDLKADKLPFAIGVMGVGGPTDKYGPEQAREKRIHDNFRKAMAAPAGQPEFKGNVVNVFTENYWDMEFVALRTRERTIKPKLDEIAAQVKAGKLAPAEGKAATEKLYSESFNKTELTILKESVSNLDFHYLGSARIMSQIGKGFAEAMAKLVAPDKK